MTSAHHWLTLTATILGEPNPRHAATLLAAGLQSTLHAYFGVRTSARNETSPPHVQAHPGQPTQDERLWERAVISATEHHPLYAFYARTASSEPATLQQIRTRGWPLSDHAAALIDGLGFTHHQLAVPVSGGIDGTPAVFGLVSECAYGEEDLATARMIQPLVTALDRHIGSLATARENQRTAPSPGAVRLTPRELVILNQIAGGSTVDGMAARLGISRRTVHKHQENLYRKLGAVDRLSAVLNAQRLGLLTASDR